MSNENPPPPLCEPSTERRERYAKLAYRLEEWAREDPEYDTHVSKLLAEELKGASVQCGDVDESGS